MAFIDRKTHGFLDYVVSVLLIAAPWLLGFYRGHAETWVPVGIGVITILYSLVTDYELGVSRRLRFGAHLILDVLGGIFLAFSPWLFDFQDRVYLPHLLFGILSIVVVICTNKTPLGKSKSGPHHRLATR